MASEIEFIIIIIFLKNGGDGRLLEFLLNNYNFSKKKKGSLGEAVGKGEGEGNKGEREKEKKTFKAFGLVLMKCGTNAKHDSLLLDAIRCACVCRRYERCCL